MNDQIAFGNVETMKIYCNVYGSIYKYVVEEHAYFHPESLLRYHLNTCGIEIVQINLHYEKMQTTYE